MREACALGMFLGSCTPPSQRHGCMCHGLARRGLCRSTVLAMLPRWRSMLYSLQGVLGPGDALQCRWDARLSEQSAISPE